MSKKLKRKPSVQYVEEDDDRPALIRGIFLDEDAQAQIAKLFQMIDQNSDGTLSKDDFQSFDAFQNQAGAAKWLELRAKFDDDCDGAITLDEFRTGFKKLALDKPAMLGSLPPASTNLAAWLDEIESRINIATKELCQQVFTWLST
eukprot:m.482843 g.482843  ORF g.482843 m.482843 type:complete len:146 (+) comp22682_c0_seq1:137-574(+)